MRYPGLLCGLLTCGLFCATSIAQDAAKPEQPPPASERPPTLDDARDLLMGGYYDRAEEAYTNLAEVEATRALATIGLARCRMARGQYREAVKGLTALGATGSREWHVAMAEALGWVGEHDKRLEQLKLAIEADRKDPLARYLLGSTLEYLGRRDEALEVYAWFDKVVSGEGELRRDAEWLTYTALGFLRFSTLSGLTDDVIALRTRHVLEEMLQPAYDVVDRTWWPARIAAGDLLRAKFNNDAEDGSVSDYRAALRINSNLPEAHVGLGAVALDGWAFEEVERRAALALETNPVFPPALHLLTRKLITERRYTEATEQADKALEVNPRDLVAIALRAAALACLYDDEGVAAASRRFEAIAPKSALLPAEVGIALGGIRQYEASERALLRAIELDPTDANTRTELGMMYMQWGPEDKARQALDASWRLDPFNERTKHTLELLEKLHHYAAYESPHFIIRYDEKRDPGLGAFLADYLESLHHELTRDYETKLEEKTVIEIFPTHKEFGVRITGKPWIHTVGACTGRVIAMDSPRRSPDLTYGPYNIANVLRHEFTHTVTLAATRNRIPHWFTEGLAVYQEDSPRSFDWNRMLADACRRDELFTLESINWAFMRPRKPTDRQQAYAQSEWMCEFIVDRWGYDMINNMLRQYREGRRQPEVTRDLLGLEMSAFDREFKAWACAQAAGWGFPMTPPESVTRLKALLAVTSDDAALHGRLARAEFDAGSYGAARDAARRAIELDPASRDGLEVFALVQAELIRQENSDAAVRQMLAEVEPILHKLAEVDPTGWTAPKMLAALYMQKEDYSAAAEQLVRLQRLCPADPFSWRGLSGIYLEQKNDDLALPQLMQLARLDDSDPDVPAEIGRILQRKGRLAEARHWLQQALYIDPFGVAVHEALAEVCMMTGDTAAALKEYTMLTRIEPDKASHHERAAMAAHKLGDSEAAARFATEAVKLDPQSSAKTLLP